MKSNKRSVDCHYHCIFNRSYLLSKSFLQVENLLGVAARHFHNVDNIVEFQKRLETFIKTQTACLNLLREEIVENKSRVAHIKSLLDPINYDYKIEPSDPVSINGGVTDMDVFLSAGPKADDIGIDDGPDHVLSFDAFATGLGDAL